MARGYRHIQEYEKEIQEAKARNSLCQRNMAGAEGIEKGLWHFRIFLYLAEIFVNTCVFNKLKQADFPAFCCFFAGIMDKLRTKISGIFLYLPRFLQFVKI